MLIGISIVRNEADIIEISVKHHIAQDIDLCLICDDDSSDGTRHLLRRLALFDPRIRWLGNSSGGFYQQEVINALAQEARRLGAEWILAFDADEFWYSPEGLSLALRRASEDMGESAAVSVEVVNFAQRRDQVRLEPHAVVRAQYRAFSPRGSVAEASDLVQSGAISYIEMQYPEKLICPAKPDV
jgi:glycosyltransferase involved in cell wall biosynthesis